uniref:hypothetical protein n=1 Tax=Microbacterium proteolyticum TaxID=1572644 RepID=UPI0024169C2C|nr:hypothetical protein [Microbacterium proteolyticum]
MDQITDPVTDAVRTAIEDNFPSIRAAASASGIPYTTLDRRLRDGSWTLAELRKLSAATDTNLLEAAAR